MAFGPLAARFAESMAEGAPPWEVVAGERAFPRDALVLDAMCGYGRVLVPWLQRNGKIHGVDNSAAMLARCEARLTQAGLTTSLFRQDIAALNLPFRYGGAFVAGSALQDLTDPTAVHAALTRLKAHLVEPGVLTVDFSVPPSAYQNAAAPIVEVLGTQLPDGTRITLRAETVWTPDARLARSQRRYAHRRGTTLLAEEYETVSSTWYTREEAVALLVDAGYVDVRVRDSIPGEASELLFTVTGRAVL